MCGFSLNPPPPPPQLVSLSWCWAQQCTWFWQQAAYHGHYLFLGYCRCRRTAGNRWTKGMFLLPRQHAVRHNTLLGHVGNVTDSSSPLRVSWMRPRLIEGTFLNVETANWCSQTLQSIEICLLLIKIARNFIGFVSGIRLEKSIDLARCMATRKPEHLIIISLVVHVVKSFFFSVPHREELVTKANEGVQAPLVFRWDQKTISYRSFCLLQIEMQFGGSYFLLLQEGKKCGRNVVEIFQVTIVSVIVQLLDARQQVSLLINIFLNFDDSLCIISLEEKCFLSVLSSHSFFLIRVVKVLLAPTLRRWDFKSVLVFKVKQVSVLNDCVLYNDIRTPVSDKEHYLALPSRQSAQCRFQVISHKSMPSDQFVEFC